MKQNIKALLLDIEGTTTPISFVTDTLFPYARSRYSSFIRENWSNSSFAPYKDAFTAENEDTTKSPDALISFVTTKHDSNEKHTAFKSLQGHIWKSGYEDGSIKSTVYADVPAAISRLQASGIKTHIYSSGSIAAQKLLFAYSDHGDLTPLLSGYNDTSTAGAKTDPTSYKKIASASESDTQSWLFLSDNVKEVAAALEAGMSSCVVDRPGNAELSEQDRARYKMITSFDEISPAK